MFCTAYERNLRGAAASTEPLSAELKRHLDSCAVCKAEWEQEEFLLRMVDAEARVAANTEMPASLLACVRQRIAETEPQRTWWKPALAFAAAMSLAAITVYFIVPRSPWPRAPEEIRNIAANVPGMPQQGGSSETALAPAHIGSVLVPGGTHARFATVEVKNDGVQPEILTSPEEMAGLLQYMRRLQTKPSATASLEPVSSEEPFAIRDVEFREIDLGVVTIAPLDGAK